MGQRACLPVPVSHIACQKGVRVLKSGVAFSVKDLCFRYPSSNGDTIKKITFDVLEGEIFGLLGPSGAGKSTTQKILVKLLDNYTGSVKYFGKDLKSMDNSFYEEIGVGFEVPVHFSKLTALENMKTGLI